MSLRCALDRHAFGWLAFALLALAMRALLPAGTMVAPGDVPGVGTFIICTGTGEARLADEGGSGKTTPAPQPCAFAGLATAALLPSVPLLIVAASPWAAVTLPCKVACTLVQQLAAPPPPAIGPPAAF